MQHKPMWDQGAEQSVIGALVADERCITDVAAIVSPEDFFYSAHQQILRTALNMQDRGDTVDIVTLTGACREHAGYLGQLAADIPGAANVAAYARVVADWSRRRAVVEACRQTIESATRTASGDLIAELSGQIEAAGERSIGESLDFRAVMLATMSAIEHAQQYGVDGIVGVPTGLPLIDRATSGLCARRLIVIAARPSMGKTALANQIFINAARAGHPVGICSLEMGEEEIGARAMAYHCRTNFTRLLRGQDDALTAVVNGIQSRPVNDWPLHLDTSTYSLTGIEARITGWVRKHGIKAAAVDHLGLVEVEGNVSPNDRLGLVTRRLKKLAKRLNIAIVGLCQMNRNNEREKRKPMLSDLRDSGNIEQDVDVALFLHVEPEDVGERCIPIHLGFLKNRTGRKGWLPEPVTFEGAYQTFSEIAPQYEDFEV